MNTWACEAVRDGMANFLMLLKKNKAYIMDNLNNFAVRAHSCACSLSMPMMFFLDFLFSGSPAFVAHQI